MQEITSPECDVLGGIAETCIEKKFEKNLIKAILFGFGRLKKFTVVFLLVWGFTHKYRPGREAPTWTKDFFVPHPTEPDVLSVKTWVLFSPHTREQGPAKARHRFVQAMSPFRPIGPCVLHMSNGGTMENGTPLIDPKTGLPFNSESSSLEIGPLSLGQFPPLGEEELKVLKLTAEGSLAQGHHPSTPVAMPFQAMCQIVVLIDGMKSELDELKAEKEDLLDKQAVLRDLVQGAWHFAKRQLLHGKHEQDREDAKQWLSWCAEKDFFPSVLGEEDGEPDADS